MFNVAFNTLTGNGKDYYPANLRSEIDEINSFVYNHINNGVYKVGFATEQSVYEEACHKLFVALETLEKRLATQRYLIGDTLTEADWRLFTTLIRFDCVYHTHFKANIKQLKDFPHLQQYLLQLYRMPKIANTVNFKHIKQHYYYSHVNINPTRIVAVGPNFTGD